MSRRLRAIDIKMPKPNPTVMISITVTDRWGTEQQRSLDSLLSWHASCASREIVQVEYAIREFLTRLGIGTIAPRSESAAKLMIHREHVAAESDEETRMHESSHPPRMPDDGAEHDAVDDGEHRFESRRSA